MTEQATTTIVHINSDETTVDTVPADAVIGENVYLDEFYDDLYDDVISSPGGLIAVGKPCRTYSGIEFGSTVRIGNGTFVGPSTLGNNVVIGAQCSIEGVIGDNSVIGDDCRIFGSVGVNSTIGVGVNIHKDAYLPADMTIPDGSIVVPVSEVEYLSDDVAESPQLIVVPDLRDQVE